MELLGVGVPELLFIVLIALLVLGPKDMVAAGRTFGRGLRKIVMSPEWQAMRQTGQELQQLPTKLMREANLEELQAMQAEVSQAGQQLQNEVKAAGQKISPLETKSIFVESQAVSGPPPAEKPAAAAEPPAAL